jgi:hypothetical protein
MSVWPQRKPDPNDDTNLESLVQDYNLWRWRPLREYIKNKHPALAEKIKEREVS